jgi:hypothetical protein
MGDPGQFYTRAYGAGHPDPVRSWLSGHLQAASLTRQGQLAGGGKRPGLPPEIGVYLFRSCRVMERSWRKRDRI